jgi:hypothetical protein
LVNFIKNLEKLEWIEGAQRDGTYLMSFIVEQGMAAARLQQGIYSFIS